jgi:hypothetical protein
VSQDLRSSKPDACEEHGEDQRHGHPEEGQRLSQLAPQVLVTSLHDFVHTHPIGRSFEERRRNFSQGQAVKGADWCSSPFRSRVSRVARSFGPV